MDKGSEAYLRFLSGDDRGMEQIITDYKDGLILYLNSLVGNIALAEELAEDTFVRLCIKKPRDKQTGSFKTWLYTIGRNVAISHMRKAGRVTTVSTDALADVADEAGDLLAGYVQEENRRLVHSALGKLKPEYRQILWLIYFEGLSFKEAAAVMKKTVHSTEMLATRARQALKKELNGMEVPL